MRKDTCFHPVVSIGMDIGDRYTHLAVVKRGGKLLGEERVKTSRAPMEKLFSKLSPRTRVVLEAGTHSPWISALLKELGLDVIVANPNQAGRAILANGKKTDKLDAILLAEFGLNSPRLLRPVRHRSLEAQAHLSVIRARDRVVEMRAKAINAVRGLVKSSGARLPSSSAEAFPRKVAEFVPGELKPAIDPMLETITQLTQTIRGYDKQVAKLCEKYPETEVLQQINGVGSLIALAYLLTLEDPKRFKRSRSVGAFVGLVSRQHESGEARPQLRITKAGNSYLRRLLITAAHYILSSHGEDCELKRFGLRLAKSEGKRGKKKAVVAVARKLAVLMHRLWRAGEVYDPFYNANRLRQRSA